MALVISNLDLLLRVGSLLESHGKAGRERKREREAACALPCAQHYPGLFHIYYLILKVLQDFYCYCNFARLLLTRHSLKNFMYVTTFSSHNGAMK